MAQPMQFELYTPLGTDVLRLHRLSSRESLGEISEFHLSCVSSNPDIDLDAILGRQGSVRITLPDGGERYFTGYFTRLSHTGTQGRYQSYEAILQPWPWFMTRTSDCRIFQNRTVPEIIKEVFADHSVAEFRDALAGSYTQREYCVQYRETDFDFVVRLMEEEGIYFFFEYEKDRNVLVLADGYGAHSPVPDDADFEFVDNERASEESNHITDWHFERIVQPGKARIIDYDFKRPKVRLDASASFPRGNDQGDHEVFDYPGDFVAQAEGEHFVRTRLDELQAQYEQSHGRTNARRLGCGMLFKLSGHVRTDQNREYLAVSTFIHLQAEGLDADGSGNSSFICDFSALASAQDFRPLRRTARPFVRGIQTAVVVGPAGDEIYTDQYGRVKVQFFWDRLGKTDENSSCWMRVAHPWAGKNWGFVTIPRIGQEVVVEFLEGDPDRPLITGSVYNGEQMPPYELPANMTQSGIKSRSSKGGTPDNFNEIRFEDKKGAEQVFIHAEKNQDIEVENDETHWVGHDRRKTIDHDENVEVKNNRTETVGVDESITIGNNRTESVGVNETISIGSNRTESVGSHQSVTIGATDTLLVGAQRTHTVGLNETIMIGAAQEVTVGAARLLAVGISQSTTIGVNHSLNVGASQSVEVGTSRSTSIGSTDHLKVGSNLIIEAGDSVTIKTGSASITMQKDGTITIKGKNITLQGSGKVNVKASGEVIVKGSKVLQN